MAVILIKQSLKKSTMKRQIIISSLIAFLLSSALLYSIAFISTSNSERTTEEALPVVQTSITEGNSTPPVNFVDAASRTLNTVVHIKTVTTKSGGYVYNPLGEFFFGNPYQKRPDQHVSGSGSGVIISTEGYIATNNHVVQGATEVTVTLNDKREFNATIVGTDPNTDLALLKIEGKQLEAIAYGNSDDVKVGQWALAVGNPFNLTSTVTAGIVSAKGRNINILKEQYAIESFIQTDAAVNPGNSGGALVDQHGNLIGINTAIASNTGSYTGYSFAVPVNVVRKVMDDLLNYGKVQRALLGIQIQDITADLAEQKSIKSLKGVYINKVFEDGAADESEIESGDIIRSINNSPVSTTAMLQEKLSQFGPGEKIYVQIEREGELITKEVVLKNQFGTTELVAKENLVLGCKFEDLTEGERKELRIKSGAKIAQLENGKLKNEGLREGFIITHIDNQPIRDSKQATEILQNKKGGVLIEGVYPSGTKAFYGFGL